MKPIQHYAGWRILYTIYWTIDAHWWTYGEYVPRLDTWLQDRMDSLGLRMGFLVSEHQETEA